MRPLVAGNDLWGREDASRREGSLSASVGSSRAQAGRKSVTTRIVIPMKAALALNASSFATDYHRDWRGTVTINRIEGDVPQSGGARKYRLSEATESLVLTTDDRPIPPELVKTTLEVAKKSALPNGFDQQDAEDFAGNIAHAVIESDPAESTGRFQAAFVLQTLLTILRHIDASIGYTPLSAQTYRSRKWVLSFLAGRPRFDPNTMFLLLGNMHLVRDGEHWIHTHGMDQFGLPDVETRFADQSRTAYFRGLVGNAALYMLGKGPVLKIGNTAEMAGDGVWYRIVTAKSDSDHGYGAFGAIGIVKA